MLTQSSQIFWGSRGVASLTIWGALQDELSELEGRFAEMQEEHARSQQDLQAHVHELKTQLKEASVSAAQHLAQVCCLREAETFFFRTLEDW